jgi:hypothetical protein
MKFIATLIVLAGFGFWFYFIRTPEAPPAPLTYSASFSGLTEPEKAYYEQMFDYTMDNTKPGEGYEWSTYSAKGKITAETVFLSKSKGQCRNFSEIFYAAGKPYPYDGIACKRQGRDGWCRLKQGDALTCAMEKPGGVAVNFGVPGAPSMSGSINVPIGGGPGIGQVGTPNAPQIEGPGKVDQKQAGQSYADTVTGTAGNAAGPATSGVIKWFGDTFR